MKKLISRFIFRFLPIVDMLLSPFIYPSAWLLKNVRLIGVKNLPHCKNALFKIGVFPIRDHYYEPQFKYENTRQSLQQDRILPGIDWNTTEQLKILSELSFSHELSDIAYGKTNQLEFSLSNGSFGSGDAEYWYQIIRLMKPKRIFEIGSGNSTLIARKAITNNKAHDSSYSCKHICIEPYEMPWLENSGISVIRRKVEDVDRSLFSELEQNDILFIDSSHIIRPQGDVTFEYLELLPSLQKGVIVHVHDIFSPRNYLKQWLVEDVRFWNEQYLLEAFLSHNSSWKIIGALNYLHHKYYKELKSVAVFLTPEREPGSFYIQRIA